MITFYDLLDVGPTASTDEILKAYKAKAVEYHPDKNDGNPGATRMFQLINEAKEVLSDPEKRAAYDFKLSGSSAGNFEGFHFHTAPRPYIDWNRIGAAAAVALLIMFIIRMNNED